MPEGLKLQPDSSDHWSIVVTRKMAVAEFNAKVEQMIANWTVIKQLRRYK
jgi:hypothetical protein